MRPRTFNIVIAVSMILVPLAMGQELSSPFPDLKGWTFNRDTTVYNPDNLWDVIDGAADLFLEYGFVDLRIGRYHKGEDAEISAELYKFDSSVDAFGMYSQERNPQHQFIDMGVQGYREEGVLNFLTGNYYVKIMTHQRGQEALDAMTALAMSLNTNLGQKNKWPAVLGLFPLRQKRLNSEQYVAKNFLGYAFFRGAYVSSYKGENSYRLFLIVPDSSNEAKSMFEAFVKASPGGSLNTSSTAEYFVRDRYNGTVGIFCFDNCIAGIVGLEDSEIPGTYLDDFRKRVGSAPRQNQNSNR